MRASEEAEASAKVWLAYAGGGRRAEVGRSIGKIVFGIRNVMSREYILFFRKP